MKSELTSLKKYSNRAKLTEQTNIFFSCFEGTRGEKNKYFAPCSPLMKTWEQIGQGSGF